MMKKMAFMGVLAGLMLVLTMALAEVAVRVFFPQLNPATQLVFYSANEWNVPLGWPGATYRHRHNAGDFDVTVTFNELGLRDVADVRRAGAGDWLYVGDSFGFGFGVEEHERASSRLDSLLPGARVFNLSAPTHIEGYGRLLQYALDLGVSDSAGVILQVFTGNDLFDFEQVVEGHTPFTSRLDRLKFRVSTRSALYQAVRYVVWNLPVLGDRMAASRSTGAVEGFTVRFDAGVIASSARMTERVLAGRTGDVLVVVAPPKSLWFGSQQQEWQRIHRAYVQAVREKGLPVLDLADVVGVGDYFPVDGHWNVGGNARVAEALFRLIGE
ncbi:MAG: hypothetical protein LAT52_10635 [Balneolales bacterium]|nr:hypothetical protein [Balneolales bacterium]